MATAKLVSLAIRLLDLRLSETLAKPISNQIKIQAKQHETFRKICVGLAQRMHRGEMELRTRLLGEPAKHVRPLSETRAIENGANNLAEGFLFTVAAALILGETWRSSRNQTKRREGVDDKLEELQSSLEQMGQRVNDLTREFEERWSDEKQKNDELARILERVVEIGLRGGWAEFEDTPLALPRIQLTPPRTRKDDPPSAPDVQDAQNDSPTSTPKSDE